MDISGNLFIQNEETLYSSLFSQPLPCDFTVNLEKKENLSTNFPSPRFHWLLFESNFHFYPHLTRLKNIYVLLDKMRMKRNEIQSSGKQLPHENDL